MEETIKATELLNENVVQNLEDCNAMENMYYIIASLLRRSERKYGTDPTRKITPVTIDTVAQAALEEGLNLELELIDKITRKFNEAIEMDKEPVYS